MKSQPHSFTLHGIIDMSHVDAICAGAATLAEEVFFDVCRDRFGSITSLAVALSQQLADMSCPASESRLFLKNIKAIGVDKIAKQIEKLEHEVKAFDGVVLNISEEKRSDEWKTTWMISRVA